MAGVERGRRHSGVRAAVSRCLVLALVTGGGLLIGLSPAAAAGGTPTITGHPTGATTATPLTWSFTASTATSCELTANGTTVEPLANCSSSATYDESTQAGGSYTFTVFGSAAAGVNGATPSATSTVSVAPVAASITTPPASPGSSRSPHWQFTLPRSATATCELTTSGGVVVTTAQACTSSYTGNLSGQPDGGYTLVVTPTANGVTGADASSSYTLDTTDPDPVTVTATPAVGNSLTPSFSVTGVESGGSLTCHAAGPGGPVSVTTCAATTTIRADAAYQGDYTLTVTQADAAGNLSAPATATYTLDTVAPATPSIDPSTATGAGATPSFTVTDTDPVSTYVCSVTGPSAATVSACGATTTIQLAGSNGVDTLRVQAEDDAGNLSAAATASYTYLGAPPDAPTVTGTAIGNDTTPSFTVTDPEDSYGGLTYSCSASGPSTVTVTDCGPSTDLDVSGGTDGDYTLDVTVIDSLGQPSGAGTVTYRLDTIAPPMPVVTGPATAGRGRAPQFSVSDTESGTTLRCSVSPSTATVTACGSTSSLSLPIGAADGPYTLSVTATDAAGNVSGAGQATYLLDRTPPAPPVVQPPTSPTDDTTPTVVITDSDPDAVAFTCSLADPSQTVIFSGTCPGDGVFGSTTDGTYTLTVSASDAAGNISTTVATWQLDTGAPTGPTVSPASLRSNILHPVFTVTPSEASPAYSCSVAPSVPVTGCAAGTPTLDLSGAPDGQYLLSVTEFDTAGNPSSPTAASYTLDTLPPPAPTVSAVVPRGSALTPSFMVQEVDPDPQDGATLTCSASPAPATVMACGSLSRLQLAGAPDGTYTLTVTAADHAGNTSTTTATYVLDTVTPAPTVTAPPSPSQLTTPAFTMSDTEAGDTFDCTFTGPHGGTLSTGSCPPGGAFDTKSKGDGVYTLLVTATDTYGNTASASATYLLDTTTPAPRVVAPPSPASSRTPTFTVSEDEAGDTLSCLLTAPDGSTSTPAMCVLGSTVVAATHGDGVYTLTVTATDKALNTATGSASYTLDSITPLPQITPPASPSLNPIPAFTLGETEAGDTLTCTWTAPSGVTLVNNAPCSVGVNTFDTAGHGDGSYVLTVVASDRVGNTDPATATYLLSSRAPTLSLATPASATANDRSPLFTVAAFQAASTLKASCVVTGPSPASATLCTPTGVQLSLPVPDIDGPYVVTLTLTDLISRQPVQASATYTLRAMLPARPLASVRTTTPSSQRDPAWQWIPGAATSDTLTPACEITGPEGYDASFACDTSNGLFTTDLPDVDGPYVLTVTVTDPYGNVSPAGTATYLLDHTIKTGATVVLTDPPSLYGNIATPTWSITGPPGSTFRCLLSDVSRPKPVFDSACPSDGQFSLTGQPDGTYALVVTSTDAEGGQSTAPASDYVYDTTAPSPPRLDRGTRSPSGATQPEFFFRLPAQTVGRCVLLHAGKVLQSAGDCSGSTTFDLASYHDGTYDIEVTSTDRAGNVSRPLSIRYVLDRSVPSRPSVAAGSAHGSRISWRISGASDDSLICWLSRAGQTVSGPKVCGRHPSFSMVGLPSGVYTLYATQTDAAGGRSSAGSASIIWRGARGGISPIRPPSGVLPPPPPTGGTGGHPRPAAPPPRNLTLPTFIKKLIPPLKVVPAPVVPALHRITHVLPEGPDKVATTVRNVVSAVGKAGGGTGFPLLLVACLVAFLIAQNRIDRRDPKLALASVVADDLVDFRPPPSRGDGR